MNGLFFHGQKPAIHGQNGTEMGFTVCYVHNSYLYTNLNGGKFMRHFYFRLIFGCCPDQHRARSRAAAVVSVVKDNISFAALYAVLGIVFLWSAYSIRKKERDKDNDQ